MIRDLQRGCILPQTACPTKRRATPDNSQHDDHQRSMLGETLFGPYRLASQSSPLFFSLGHLQQIEELQFYCKADRSHMKFCKYGSSISPPSHAATNAARLSSVSSSSPVALRVTIGRDMEEVERRRWALAAKQQLVGRRNKHGTVFVASVLDSVYALVF